MTIVFNYLIKKIKEAQFSKTPFEHIYIEDFFNEKHFKEIINSRQINLTYFKSTKELCNGLLINGFEPVHFPGCTTDINEYCIWERGDSKEYKNVDTTEGFGMAFRLQKPEVGIINEVRNFIQSKELMTLLCEKFEIKFDNVFSDVGIQKYLNGYEISPHPDVRSKALTFMVNINPGFDSEQADFHTHYMRFIDRKKYIYDFWKYNLQYDRAWVPWSWCETIKKQETNNSIVIFKPTYKTLHAVKAKYNHLTTQRTQLYGNLWYKKYSKSYQWHGSDIPQIPWQGLVIDESKGSKHQMQKSQMSKIKRLGKNLKKIYKNFVFR